MAAASDIAVLRRKLNEALQNNSEQLITREKVLSLIDQAHNQAIEFASQNNISDNGEANRIISSLKANADKITDRINDQLDAARQINELNTIEIHEKNNIFYALFRSAPSTRARAWKSFFQGVFAGIGLIGLGYLIAYIIQGLGLATLIASGVLGAVASIVICVMWFFIKNLWVKLKNAYLDLMEESDWNETFAQRG